MGEKKLTKTARKLRRNMTDTEILLWSHLRGSRLESTKFVKQFPIGPYVADFAARSLKLIIELDGGQHSESKADENRTKVIEAHGYHIVRFWNNDVMDNIDGVLEVIRAELKIARGR